jgi:hypothetical protein
MRYFESSNANREYKVGGFSYRFDPADNIGGAWSGVLAIENEEAATVLANNLTLFPQIKEITEEEYLEVKKKGQPRSSYSNPLVRLEEPLLPSSPAAAAEAEATPDPNSNKPTLDEAVKLAPAAIFDELSEEPVQATPAAIAKRRKGK